MISSLVEYLAQGYEIKTGTVTRKYTGILLQKGTNVVACEADIPPSGNATKAQCVIIR